MMKPITNTPKLSRILFHEQDDGSYDSPGYEGGYGVSTGGGGSGSGSSNSMWARNGIFGAMGFAAIKDIWNILKRDTAKLGVQALATVGSLFAGTLTILLPFNSHLATSYVTKKFMFWEMRAIKSINQQFEKELAGFDDGWELIKPDLIGLGFFIAPYGVVGNVMAAGQAIDTAVSITNVMTGGLVGYLIERIVNVPEDMRDPGNLDSYVRSHLYRPFSYSSNNWKERGVIGNLFHMSNDELESPHMRRHAYDRLMEESGVGGSKYSVNSQKLKADLTTLRELLGDTYAEDMKKFMAEVLQNTSKTEADFVRKNSQALLAPMFPAIKADLQTNAQALKLSNDDLAHWNKQLSQKKNVVLDTMMKRYQSLIGKDPSGRVAAKTFEQVMLSAMGWRATKITVFFCFALAIYITTAQPHNSAHRRHVMSNHKRRGRKASSEEPNSMPENLNDLKPIVTEFIDRYKRLENEEQELKLQKKELVEEYADKLDTKTLKLAMKEVELRAKVERKHYFDLFVHVLGGEVD